MAKTRTEGLGTKKEFAIYLALLISISSLLAFFLKDTNQTLAATNFLAIVLGTLMFWRFRVATNETNGRSV